MNILGRPLFLAGKHRSPPSRLAAVLPRIRAIRERCDWRSFVSPPATHRREHLARARGALSYHPVSCPRVLKFSLPLRRTWWFRLAVWIAVLCFAALACALLLL